MRRYQILVNLLFPILASLTHGQSNDFQDFLKMDLCLNSAGQPVAEIPGVHACQNRRETISSDRLPYVLQLHHANADAADCKKHDGWMRKINIPIVFNNHSRIASYFDKGYNEPCGQNSAIQFGRMTDSGDKLSIYNVDNKWGSIYYSSSENGGTFYHTPTSYLLRNQSEQFKNGWILAPRFLPSRKSDGSITVGAQHFSIHAYNSGNATEQPSMIFNRFTSNSYVKALTLWARGDFQYRSGITLDTVVSFHYSGDNANSLLHPGESRSVEKLFFTDETGLLRWEVWKRDDYYPNDGARLASVDYAAKKSNRCSKPFDLPSRATADMVTGIMSTDAQGAIYEVVRKAGNLNSGHKWYLVDCFDYTNFKLNHLLSAEQYFNPTGYRPNVDSLLNDGQMIYFFK